MTLTIADVGIRVHGPLSVLHIVSEILSEVPRPVLYDRPPVEVEVHSDQGIWRITGVASRSKKVLQSRTLPHIAGAVVSAILSEIGYHSGIRMGRATVMERDGNGLVMVGDDWESSITLAAHMHTRGWRYLSSDYVLLSPSDVVQAVGVRKLLHMTSRSLSALPQRYRPAVEASPWYLSAADIAFYAVNPASVAGQPPWADHARIRGLLRLDGHVADSPVLEDIGGNFEVAEGVSQAELAAAGVEFAQLVRGSFSATYDLLERWFSSLPAGKV